MFARKSGFSAAQNTALISCAILVIQELGPKAIMRMDISQKPILSQNILSKNFDIKDEAGAKAFLENLATANNHTPLVAEVFDNVISNSQYEIIRGIFSPLKQDAITRLDLAKNFRCLWQNATNDADMPAFLDFLNNPQDGQGAIFHNITASAILSRINKCVKGYETAIRSLKVFGYTPEELVKINTFIAWDIGRCGYVARLCVNAGYIVADDAWKYMQIAGRAAYVAYTSWRQFLAAYFLGRCMYYSADDMGNFGENIRFLLKDKKSPYSWYPLRTLS